MSATEPRIELMLFLQAMPHVGHGGFEGFVAAILGAETRHRFRGVRSGSQHGRDLESESGPLRIKVEAKHYFSSSLNQRELIAEVRQAVKGPDRPDLWILATPVEVDPDRWRELRAEAAGEGVDCLALDGSDNGIGRLQVLAAAHRAAVMAFADAISSPADRQRLDAELASVAEDPRYAAALAQVRNALEGTLLGHADAATRARRALVSVLSSEREAFARFHQNVAVRAPSTATVPRRIISDFLTAWFQGPAITGRNVVVLGEEGTGKSWAVFNWLAHLAAQGLETVIIPFSAAAETLEPGTDIEMALPALLAKWTGVRGEDDWRIRLQRWLSGDDRGRSPSILLVVDGLNERSEVNWATFFAPAFREAWAGKVAIVVTDRPAHWQDSCSSLNDLSFTDRLLTDGYSAEELSDALTRNAVRFDDIPEELRCLLRIPRYCGLVCRNIDAMLESGDFSRARVLYIDAMEAKRNKLGYPMTPSEFEDIIRAAAARHRVAQGRFSRAELAALLPFRDKERDVVGELTSGGTFVETRPGRFAVEPGRLAYALGMLLAEVVQEAAEDGADAARLTEEISAWFEPEPNADLKVEAAAAALFHAVLEPNFPLLGRKSLLIYWVGLRNWQRAAEDALTAYVMRVPEDFIAAAEDFWARKGENGAAQSFLANAFARFRNHARVAPVLEPAMTRWLGLVHTDGFSEMRERGTQVRWGATKNEILERLEPISADGSCVAFGHRLTVTDSDELMRIRRLALLLSSVGDKEALAEAFLGWAVSSAVMGVAVEAEEAAWVLRFSGRQLAERLLEGCGSLLSFQDPVADEAARFVSEALGTREAYELLERHPRTPDEGWVEAMRKHDESPCDSVFELTEAQCLCCMAGENAKSYGLLDRCETYLLDPDVAVPATFLDRCIEEVNYLDPSAIQKGLSSTQEQYQLDRYEKLLAGRRPEALASYWKKVIATIEERSLDEVETLSNVVRQLTPIIGEREVSIFLAASQRLDRATLATDRGAEGGGPYDQRQLAASNLVQAALGALSADERWLAVLDRPEGAFENLEFERWFEMPSPETMASILAIVVAEDAPRSRRSRALWFTGEADPVLDDGVRRAIIEMARGDDALLRSLAYRFAGRSTDAVLVARLLGLSGDFSGEDSWLATQGTIFLVDRGHDVPIEDLVARLHPASFTFVPSRQLRSEADVRYLAAAFERAWQAVTASAPSDRPALPTVLVPASPDDAGRGRPLLGEGSEAGSPGRYDSVWLSGTPPDQVVISDRLRREGPGEYARRSEARMDALRVAWGMPHAAWYARAFDPAGLGRLLDARPGLARLLVSRAVAEGPAGSSVRRRMASFHVALVAPLFERDAAAAEGLWRTMARETQTQLAMSAVADVAFAATDCPESFGIREAVLSSCSSDAEISYVSAFAERHERYEWLRETVQTLVRAEPLTERALGLTLASFSSIRRSCFEAHIVAADVGGTWVEDKLPSLRENHALGVCARRWHERFVSEAQKPLTHRCR